MKYGVSYKIFRQTNSLGHQLLYIVVYFIFSLEQISQKGCYE